MNIKKEMPSLLIITQNLKRYRRKFSMDMYIKLMIP